jgi:hypothetical protein
MAKLAVTERDAAHVRTQLQSTSSRCEALNERLQHAEAARSEALKLACTAGSRAAAERDGAVHADALQAALTSHLDEAARTVPGEDPTSRALVPPPVHQPGLPPPR